MDVVNLTLNSDLIPMSAWSDNVVWLSLSFYCLGGVIRSEDNGWHAGPAGTLQHLYGVWEDGAGQGGTFFSLFDTSEWRI